MCYTKKHLTDQIFCLPVPEKTKRQHNFVVIPNNAHGLLPIAAGAPEPIIWTAFEPAAKDTEAPKEPQHTAELLNKQLKPFGKRVVFPDETEFASAIQQSHRKGEVAFHVKAHRGSKDGKPANTTCLQDKTDIYNLGYLYLLGPGILWAFKKPLLFLPYSSITSISYTSVLQRTFNLNINASSTSLDGTIKEEEIEFSMLDQADFAGIDDYIKRHGLNDASLAAGRRAKRYGVNDPKVKEEANGSGENGAVAAEEDEDMEDGETELQKAERMLQDEEDEEEEVSPLSCFSFSHGLLANNIHRTTLTKDLMMDLYQVMRKATKTKLSPKKARPKYLMKKRSLLRRKVVTRMRVESCDLL
jgi:hypothetical protein